MSLALKMADSVPIVVILGATGAGKSKLALELAAKFGGEIISADAMQMYKGLDIVTNKVTPEEQKLVPHHLINILDPLQTNTVVDFRNRALPEIERMLREGKIPFICGGTNYYIESLIWKILVDQELPILGEIRKRMTDEERSEGESESKISTADDNIVLTDGGGPDMEKLGSMQFEKDDNTVSTTDLYHLLQSLDPQRASMLHRAERRKIWRSLQVLKKTGKKHSDVLGEQGEIGMGGCLRFPKERICLIEVWSEQAVLDERCDARVEKMMERGLVAELEDFHERFNKEREAVRASKHSDEMVPDYHKGIWQSIGFKEFHPYLQLSDDERQSKEGLELFNLGVKLMKIATRQYARRQVKWMRRFLISKRDPPPYYRVDSTDPEQWQHRVYSPAEAILTAILEGREVEEEPLPLIEKDIETLVDERRVFHCDICDRDLKGSTQFKRHMNSKPHQKVVAMQTSADHRDLNVRLEEFKPGLRVESAKLLKSSFQIRLADVLSKLDTAPCNLVVIPGKGGGEKKVKSLIKELQRQGIILSYSRLEEQED